MTTALHGITGIALLCAAAVGQGRENRRPVPTADALHAARSAALEAFVDLAVLRAADDVDGLVRQMLAEAQTTLATPGPSESGAEAGAVGFVLFEQCLHAARRGGSLSVNLEVNQAMGAAFAVDPIAQHMATFEALRSRSTVPVRHLVLAIGELALDSVDKPQSPALANAGRAATEWARQHGDARALAWIERTLAEAAAARAAWTAIDRDDEGAVAAFRCRYLGDWLVGEGELLGDSEDAKLSKVDTLRFADRLRAAADALEESDAPPADPGARLVGHNLRTRALHWYRMAYLHSEGLERERIVRQMSALEDALTRGDELGRLAFDDPTDRDELVYARGDWHQEDGRLVGRVGDAGVASTATLAMRYEAMDCVILRAGIASAAGLNLRLAVGSCNVLFNWEVRPESHVYFGGHLETLAGRRLTTRTVHDIRVRTIGPFVVVFLDDVELARHPGILEGTVSVYPALHSEIFVEDLAVLGRAALEGGPVTGPSHTCR